MEIYQNLKIKNFKTYHILQKLIIQAQQSFEIAGRFNPVQIEIEDSKNGKIYGLLGIIDLNNWKEMKGQSLWVNATLEEQKEINNSKYLCFLFVTSTLNDLLSFHINLIDDNNKDIKFKDNLRKINILNFQIDVFQK